MNAYEIELHEAQKEIVKLRADNNRLREMVAKYVDAACVLQNGYLQDCMLHKEHDK